MNPCGVSVAFREKFREIFVSLGPINGKLSGEQVRPTFIKSGLDNSQLRMIWSLVDVDEDGFLQVEDFILAMGLIYDALSGRGIPHALPKKINEVSKITEAEFDWYISPAEKMHYEMEFGKFSLDNLVDRARVFDIYKKSDPNADEFDILWKLVKMDDIEENSLCLEQYVLFQHISKASRNNKALPSILPPELRKKVVRPTKKIEFEVSLDQKEEIKELVDWFTSYKDAMDFLNATVESLKKKMVE